MFKKFLKKIKNLIVFIRYPAVWRPDTPFFVRLYYSLAIRIFSKEYSLRNSKIFNLQTKILIDKKKGYLISNLKLFEKFNENINSNINSLKKDFYKTDWSEISKTHSKKFLLIKHLDVDQRIKELIRVILPTVTEYLDGVPVLQDFSFWYSPNNFNDNLRSQNWHMDGEDLKQVKVWIPVEEVDENSGPLNILDKETTFSIQDKLKLRKRNTKIPDDKFYSVLPIEKKKQVLLKNLDIAFVDTCNCYHYGSRKDLKDRKLIHLHFTSAFSENIPFVKRKKLINNNDLDELVYKYYYSNFEYVKRTNKLSKFQIKIF